MEFPSRHASDGPPSADRCSRACCLTHYHIGNGFVLARPVLLTPIGAPEDVAKRRHTHPSSAGSKRAGSLNILHSIVAKSGVGKAALGAPVIPAAARSISASPALHVVDRGGILVIISVCL